MSSGGMNVEDSLTPAALPVSVVELNRSALSKAIVTDEMVIGAPLVLCNLSMPPSTVPPGTPVVATGLGTLMTPPTTGVGVGAIIVEVDVGVAGTGVGLGVAVGG